MAEAKYCLDSGAHELDVVLNRSYLKSRPMPQYNSIYNELAALRALAPHPTVLKLTLETSKLSQGDIVAACVLAGAANFDYVKTSTGYNGRGAKLEDVRLMFACCEVLGEAAVGGWAGVSEENEYTYAVARDSPRNSRGSDKSAEYQFDGWRRVKKRKMQVKASGGINTLEDAVSMLQAGATLLGTSGGVWILKEAREKVEWGIRRQQQHLIRERSKSLSTAAVRKDSKTPTTVKGHSRSKSSGQHTLQVPPQIPPSASGLTLTSMHDFATGPRAGRRSSNFASDNNKPLPPLPSIPRHIRSAHHGSDGLIAITVSARTNNLATLHSLQKTFSNPFGGPLDPSDSGKISDAAEYRQRSQSLANASTVLAATAGKGALTTVTVAGVSDVWGRGMLGGNGIVLSRRLEGDRDRPGLATRLFSDY